MNEPKAAIAPEPDEAVRAAILEALAEPGRAEPGWAAAALREGVASGGDWAVSERAAASFEDHDVCSLW